MRLIIINIVLLICAKRVWCRLMDLEEDMYTNWILTLTNFNVSQAGSQDYDLKKDSILRIVGGKGAKIEEYPWLAQVILLDKMHCGGVIVSSRVILTAAHCIYLEAKKVVDPRKMRVLLGSSVTLEGTKYKVCKFLRHPLNGRDSRFVYFYDVALILLSTKIFLSQRVQIAPLVPHGKWKTPGTIMSVAGYGYSSLTTERATLPKTLRKTRMRFVDRMECNRSGTDDGSIMPVPNHMFCLIGDKRNSDCFGDSGTGVMWKNYVVGIVSTGREQFCGSTIYPSMYSDITYFKYWIKSSIKHLEARSVCRPKLYH